MSLLRRRPLAHKRASRWAATFGLVVAAHVALSAGATAAAATRADPFGEHTPILVVMDTSGSMDEPISADGRRIDAARSAMLDLVDALPSQQPYGMVAYPGGANDDAGCTRGRLETPLAKLNQLTASAAIRRLHPSGETPTGPALRHARDVIEEAGYDQGTIVLVSDGESNCGPDPCEVARDIRASGYDVVVNTVGFRVQGDAETELTCVADATGGRYVGVDDEAGLTEALLSGAQAHLTVDVAQPENIDVSTGADLGAGQFRVTVGSDGRFPAHDVRVTLTLQGEDGSPGGVLVPRPVTFLGNLAPSGVRTVDIGVRADESMSGVAWSVTVTAENADPVVTRGTVTVREHVQTADLGPLLQGVTRVAVLGDSYASGEGTTLYRASDGDRCHRSDDTYAGVIWGSKAKVIACSGAVTHDIFGRQQSGDSKEVPQLLSLRAEAVGPDSPQAVLLSIGGNDVGFASAATACVMKHLCGILAETGPRNELTTALGAMLDRANAVGPDVFRVLQAVDAAVNDKQALERRSGKVAPVLVMPYPRIVPSTATAVGSCMVGVSSREVDYVNQFLDALNNSIALASYHLRGQGRPVYFVDDVIESFQPDHTICEGAQSYANMDNWSGIRMGKIGALQDRNELLHPNLAGHRAEARALVTWTHGALARPVQVKGTPRWNAVVRYVDDPSWLDRAGGAVLDFLTGPVASVGAPEAVDAQGYPEGSDVIIRIDSDPTVIGTAVADAHGEIRRTMRIPPWVEPGHHHVRLFGVDQAGQQVVRNEPLRVWPRATRGSLVSGLCGVALFCASGFVLVRRRRA